MSEMSEADDLRHSLENSLEGMNQLVAICKAHVSTIERLQFENTALRKELDRYVVRVAPEWRINSQGGVASYQPTRAELQVGSEALSEALRQEPKEPAD